MATEVPSSYALHFRSAEDSEKLGRVIFNAKTRSRKEAKRIRLVRLLSLMMNFASLSLRVFAPLR